jgi:peroxiredoxin
MKNKFARVIAGVAILLLATPVLASALEVGDRAPTFSAVSTGGEISLSDYAGKQHVVLALYFAVFTPV